jgi:hypothetical protein
MKFLVPNYSCLQNPWLGGSRPQIPVLCPLSSTEIVEPPPGKKFLGTPLVFDVLTQTTLQNLTTVSTSNPIPKIIKSWNIEGNVTLGKLNYRRAVYIFTQYLISHTFSTNCLHCYILHLKKTEQTNRFQYKYTFYDQDHIWWISNFCYNYNTKKLNFWLEIKQHIWQWKDKGDCSRNVVPYVIFIIWMTDATT